RPGLFMILVGGSQIVFLPLGVFVESVIFFVVFNVIMGGAATFKQMLAVIAHSAVMLALQQFVTIPLNYLRCPITRATTLSVLRPMFDDSSVVGRLLGMIDLFWIWSIVVHSIGLGVLYRRSSRAIATTLLILYVAIALCIALFRGR